MVIVYQSNTGFTQQYAEMLAKAEKIKAYELEDAVRNLEKGAQVIYIGCTVPSTASSLADHVVKLSGRTKFSRPEDPVSIQPMSTLFEQQLYLLGDVIALELMERNGWDEAYVKSRHANLE